MRSHRTERAAEQLRLELARLIESEVRDPRVGFATVTEVRLASDMRSARVLVNVLGDEEQERSTMKGLVAAANFLRHELSEALSLRHTPELSFEIDKGQENSQRVEELLKRIKPKKE